MKPLLPALAILSLCAACAAPDGAGELDRAADPVTVANGSSLNGSSLNGSSLNGSDLGSTLASVALDGAKVVAGRLDSLSLDGTVFHGSIGTTLYSGTDFAGAKFDGLSGDGTAVKLKITGVHPGVAPRPEVWEYDVVVKTDLAWVPLCTDGWGVTHTAIPVMGRWDYRQGVAGGGSKIDDPGSFTFACSGMSAIAKCVTLGYEPWATVSGQPLADFHQACTRLIRADYCGDGTSYTVNGQWVDVYDGLGVQHDDQPLWIPEAEWDGAGARCFNPYNRSHSLLPCFSLRVMPGCGDPLDFLLGTQLIDKTPPPLGLP
jgi:hypothetical protein